MTRLTCAVLVTILAGPLIVAITQASSQASASKDLPVLRPKVIKVGVIRDETPTGTRLPLDAGLSPNGKLIAFTTGTGLWIRNINTGQEDLALEDSVHAFSWSPRGDALAITRPPANERGLWILPIDAVSGKPTGPPALIGPGPANHAPCFSPDGRLVAYARESTDTTSTVEKYPPVSLAVATVDGGGIRTLATAVELRIERWAPDGSDPSRVL